MRDPYSVLGLDPTANQAAIKRAFRLRAKILHPDANPGDPVAEAAFRALTEAYATLSDPLLKSVVDAHLPPDADTDSAEDEDEKPHPDFHWQESEPEDGVWPAREAEPLRVADPDFPYKEAWSQATVTRPVAQPPPHHWPEEAWTAMEDAGLNPERAEPTARAVGEPEPAADPESEMDLFDELYASPDLGRKRSAKAKPHAALDQHYSITIPFMLAARGGTQRLLLGGDRDLEVAIPAGIHEGAVLRLTRMGSANPSGGDPGDALFRIGIDSHPLFQRDGADLLLSLPIGLDEALLGGPLQVPTLQGLVRVKLPPGLGATAKLRLTGYGLPRNPGRNDGELGDQILDLYLVLPSEPDQRLLGFLETWRPARSPRDEAGYEELLDRMSGSLPEAATIQVDPE
ncbi:MAG: hypothetical protein Kilf2KO_44770 [Rhodospirillales bacterium]